MDKMEPKFIPDAETLVDRVLAKIDSDDNEGLKKIFRRQRTRKPPLETSRVTTEKRGMIPAS